MKLFAISFISILLSMLVLDSIWLTTMYKRFYSYKIGHLLSSTPKLSAAAFFYLIYSFALSLFVTIPAVQQGWSFGQVFIWGALFGLVTYATYDLTNQATMKNWPMIVTTVDLIWGTILTGVVSIIATMITLYFTKT